MNTSAEPPGYSLPPPGTLSWHTPPTGGPHEEGAATRVPRLFRPLREGQPGPHHGAAPSSWLFTNGAALLPFCSFPPGVTRLQVILLLRSGQVVRLGIIAVMHLAVDTGASIQQEDYVPPIQSIRFIITFVITLAGAALTYGRVSLQERADRRCAMHRVFDPTVCAQQPNGLYIWSIGSAIAPTPAHAPGPPQGPPQGPPAGTPPPAAEPTAASSGNRGPAISIDDLLSMDLDALEAILDASTYEQTTAAPTAAGISDGLVMPQLAPMHTLDQGGLLTQFARAPQPPQRAATAGQPVTEAATGSTLLRELTAGRTQHLLHQGRRDQVRRRFETIGALQGERFWGVCDDRLSPMDDLAAAEGALPVADRLSGLGSPSEANLGALMPASVLALRMLKTLNTKVDVISFEGSIDSPTIKMAPPRPPTQEGLSLKHRPQAVRLSPLENGPLHKWRLRAGLAEAAPPPESSEEVSQMASASSSPGGSPLSSAEHPLLPQSTPPPAEADLAPIADADCEDRKADRWARGQARRKSAAAARKPVEGSTRMLARESANSASARAEPRTADADKRRPLSGRALQPSTAAEDTGVRIRISRLDGVLQSAVAEPGMEGEDMGASGDEARLRRVQEDAARGMVVARQLGAGGRAAVAAAAAAAAGCHWWQHFLPEIYERGVGAEAGSEGRAGPPRTGMPPSEDLSETPCPAWARLRQLRARAAGFGRMVWLLRQVRRARFMDVIGVDCRVLRLCRPFCLAWGIASDEGGARRGEGMDVRTPWQRHEAEVAETGDSGESSGGAPSRYASSEPVMENFVRDSEVNTFDRLVEGTIRETVRQSHSRSSQLHSRSSQSHRRGSQRQQSKVSGVHRGSLRNDGWGQEDARLSQLGGDTWEMQGARQSWHRGDVEAAAPVKPCMGSFLDALDTCVMLTFLAHHHLVANSFLRHQVALGDHAHWDLPEGFTFRGILADMVDVLMWPGGWRHIDALVLWNLTHLKDTAPDWVLSPELFAALAPPLSFGSGSLLRAWEEGAGSASVRLAAQAAPAWGGLPGAPACSRERRREGSLRARQEEVVQFGLEGSSTSQVEAASSGAEEVGARLALEAAMSMRCSCWSEVPSWGGAGTVGFQQQRHRLITAAKSRLQEAKRGPRRSSFTATFKHSGSRDAPAPKRSDPDFFPVAPADCAEADERCDQKRGRRGGCTWVDWAPWQGCARDPLTGAWWRATLERHPWIAVCFADWRAPAGRGAKWRLAQLFICWTVMLALLVMSVYVDAMRACFEYKTHLGCDMQYDFEDLQGGVFKECRGSQSCNHLHISRECVNAFSCPKDGFRYTPQLLPIRPDAPKWLKGIRLSYRLLAGLLLVPLILRDVLGPQPRRSGAWRLHLLPRVCEGPPSSKERTAVAPGGGLHAARASISGIWVRARFWWAVRVRGRDAWAVFQQLLAAQSLAARHQQPPPQTPPAARWRLRGRFTAYGVVYIICMGGLLVLSAFCICTYCWYIVDFIGHESEGSLIRTWAIAVVFDGLVSPIFVHCCILAKHALLCKMQWVIVTYAALQHYFHDLNPLAKSSRRSFFGGWVLHSSNMPRKRKVKRPSIPQ
ncbi:hypothetical protein CYMTET_19945 [Cymbomonas tetramitiformis]|uniref:Uncharacterized protein n=1 Tax=Cymbomonas tetramitiformis TaxID=36881 RepID=A0AAE0L4G5_9CHLO|nr:hypothetical protein CYMTET_19945 [Cymbomonas tetramitiformis]